MTQSTGRNRLTPWYVGLALNLVIVAYAAWEMTAGGCAAPPATLVIALVAMPVVYVALMYLTLTSQA
jgi:hypothetical protein